MIVFFGPAGAGKSVQGQILAARHGWRWLSTGQLLRDGLSEELHAQMRTGNLVSDSVINEIVLAALTKAQTLSDVILDGYPRNLDQAKYLVDKQSDHGHSIELAIVLEVPRAEIMQRLMIRGRADDTEEAIDRRLMIFKKEIYPILGYLTEQGVPVVHIVGDGTVGRVHDKIEAELVDRGIVEES